MKKIANTEASAYIANRKPFTSHTGNFSGTLHYGSSVYTGKMPHDTERETMLLDNELGNIEYIVWSYQTPIAWYNRRTGQWTKTKHKYSVTTSGKHMNNLGF